MANNKRLARRKVPEKIILKELGEMTGWKKRKSADYSIDFETLEDIFSEMLEEFEKDGVDFTKPVKLGFSLSLGTDGCIRVDEFGMLSESNLEDNKKDEPLVEVIDLGKELLVVVETTSLPESDIDVKVLESSMIVTNHNSKKFLKKVHFPCKVHGNAVNTNFNNGVLEIRLPKNNPITDLETHK